MKIANIMLTAVVAHILSPHDFGVFAVATTAFTIVACVSDLGVAAYLMRGDTNMDELAPTVVTISLLMSAVLAGGMYVLAHPIAVAIGSGEAASSVQVLAIAVLLSGIFMVPGAQITREFRQDTQFISTVVSFGVSTAVLILLARHGSGALAFAWSRVIGQAVQGAVIMMSVRRQYLGGFSRQAASVLFKFGLPLAGANLVNYILVNVDYALVGRLMGAAALGTYVLAFNVSSWPSSLLSTVINTVAMPAFSRVHHDAALLRKAVGDAVRAVSLIAMPMCALSIALARPIVLTLYGPRWIAAASVLSILAFYGLAAIICTLFASMLAGLGRTKAVLIVQVVWLVPLVVAMAVGVRKDGIVGAAIAHVAVIIPIVLPFYLFTLRRATSVRLLALGRAALPAAIASCLAAVGTIGTTHAFSQPLVQLIAGGVVGGLIYVLAAAPFLIVTLLGGRASHPAVRRILRSYNSLARLLGFSLEGLQPKHIRRHQRRYAEAGYGQGTPTRLPPA